MIKPLRQSLIIIVLVLLLPTVFFSIYEIGSLRNNEQMIEDIYANQLDAILYSINQYSEAVMSSWAEDIKSCISEPENSNNTCVKQFITEIPSAISICLYNPKKEELSRIASRSESMITEESIRTLLQNNDSSLQRLGSYLKEKYRKIESIALPDNNYQALIFGVEKEGELHFVIILQDPDKFINLVLDPKIQEIAQEKFYIAAINTSKDSIIYSSDRQNALGSIEHQQAFWLLPHYSMGIELLDSTISDLVHTRSRKNIILIGLIDLVLLIGIWLIYRNVKKQIELSQLKSDFVSNVSHEIRTPLALISMYIETLEMGRVKTIEKTQEYYKVIQHETHRLTGIVNKILNFSQIESGKRRYSFEDANLNTIVQSVYKSYIIRMDKEGFQHSIKLADKLPVIHADKEAITDAIINLTDNAIKYSSALKSIEYQTSVKNDHIRLSVQDKGIGISENDQKHIFDKFYRVTEKNLALKAKGSGLGLAIVKHILDAHNGKIEIESKMNEGTRFTLVFPILKS